MNLKQRYEHVKAGLPANVKLVAVSKLRTAEEIQALYDLGHRAFGENYPQELREKQKVLPADIEWHFIGHLQRSNAKHVVGITSLIHGVDSERLLDELDKRAGQGGITVNALLQVHIAQEETKHGFDAAEAEALVHRPDFHTRWPHVTLCGLMGMATNTEDRAVVRSEFAGLAGLFRSLQPQAGDGFNVLSMGMSDDVDLAVAEGSTLVRIGTAIFGPRPNG
jgi:PLP dependent protein